MRVEGLFIIGVSLVLAVAFSGYWRRTLHWAFTALANSMVAVLGIFVWNRVMLDHGLAVGLNPATAIVTGILGLPGFGLVLAVKLLGA